MITLSTSVFVQSYISATFHSGHAATLVSGWLYQKASASCMGVERYHNRVTALLLLGYTGRTLLISASFSDACLYSGGYCERAVIFCVKENRIRRFVGYTVGFPEGDPLRMLCPRSVPARSSSCLQLAHVSAWKPEPYASRLPWLREFNLNGGGRGERAAQVRRIQHHRRSTLPEVYCERPRMKQRRGWFQGKSN